MKPKRPVRPAMTSYAEQDDSQSQQSNGNNESNSSTNNTKETPVNGPFSQKNKSPFSGNPPQSNPPVEKEQVYNNPPSTKNQRPNQVPNKTNENVSQNQQKVQNYEQQKVQQESPKKEVQKRGNAYTLSETSQSHKRNPKAYKINPKVIPRPNHFDEIFKNEDEQTIYNTDNVLPPYSNTHYIVNENHNTTPRILRSTLNIIPPDFNVVTTSHLMFGLNCQPFAEFHPQEREIPKVEVPDGIFRCKRCEAYINNKFKIDFSKNNKRVATCNLCGFQNELDTTNPKVKSEYFNSSVSVPELSYPTIDYIAPNNMKHPVPFEPHYIFMIDVSQISVDVGLPNYILNSIVGNLETIHNAENSSVAIATFDHKSIKFFWVDKSEVKVAVVMDAERPFAPLPRSKLYMNAIGKREEIEKIVEKIGTITQNTQKVSMPGSISGAAISAGMQTLKGNGGRVILFTSNSCLHGFAHSRPRDERLVTIPEKEKQLYTPQHTIFKELAEQFSEDRIAVDLFVIGNTQLDLPTFSQICNFTGGKAHFYSISTKINNDLNQKLEKMHYDLSRILSRPNYYDVKFMFRNSIGLEVQEIFGPFGRKLGEGFKLPSMDPDFSFSYNLKIAEKLTPNTAYHFQIACLFIDNYNQRYLRMLNYSVTCDSDIGKMYYNVDVDTMTKLMIQKEMILICSSNLEKVQARENFTNRIINFLLYYRKKCSEKSPMQQLILPASVKFIPLFLNALMKKAVLRKNKEGVFSSVIYHQIHCLLRDPVYWTIKFLHPKFYRVDDILKDQDEKVDDPKFVLKNIGLYNENHATVMRPYTLPLSLDYVDIDSAFILDNGEFINVYVFDQIEESFYQDVFGVNSFSEINQAEQILLDESNESELNKRLLSLVGQMRTDNKGVVQPLRMYFLNEKTIHKDELINHLCEDQYRDETFYVDYLAEVHQNIQTKMH